MSPENINYFVRAFIGAYLSFRFLFLFAVFLGGFLLPWSAFLMMAFAFLFAAGGDFRIWELRQEICVRIKFYKVQVFQNAGFPCVLEYIL